MQTDLFETRTGYSIVPSQPEPELYPLRNANRQITLEDEIAYWGSEENMNRVFAAAGMPPRYRNSDPPTSQAAADSMEKGGAHQHRIMCMTCLILYGEQTGAEIAKRTGLSVEQVCRRLPELGEAGTIERVETGTHNAKPLYKTRNNERGRPCVVWRVRK